MEDIVNIKEPIDIICSRYRYKCVAAELNLKTLIENAKGELFPSCYFDIMPAEDAGFAPVISFREAGNWAEYKPSFVVSVSARSVIADENLEAWHTRVNEAYDCVKTLNAYLADQYGFVDGGVLLHE